jgi:hypothetical protein
MKYYIFATGFLVSWSSGYEKALEKAKGIGQRTNPVCGISSKKKKNISISTTLWEHFTSQYLVPLDWVECAEEWQINI